MSSEELKKFAEELKESREKAEITLQQVSSKTRIDFKFLKALEDGDFEIQPEVYIRAFIKEYALVCGLDPEKTLKKYELAKKGKLIDNIEEPVEEEIKIEEKENKSAFVDQPTMKIDNSAYRLKHKLFVYSGISLAVLIIIAVYFIFINNSSQQIVVEKPFEEVLKEQNQRFEVIENNSNQTLIKSVDSLLLNINAVDTCWINITVDGNVEYEFTLYPNTSKAIRAAEKFDVVVGNIGGISLKLNETPLQISGRIGQRRTFTINKSGIINPSK